jgi:hypothetical protein
MPRIDERQALIAEAVAHSRFKIEWAKNHINGVEALVNASIAENAYPIVVQSDAQSGLILIGPKQGIPVGLRLHLGDAVHGLNSALDFLWSGLARTINPGLANGRVHFPRHEARENLESDFEPGRKHAAIHKAFPKTKSFILDDVKPYKRADGQSFIWHLGKIDNINKHRMLITTPYVIRFERELVLEGADGGKFVHSAEAAIQTQGHPLRIGLAPPVKISDDPKATLGIVFGEPEHFTGQPVVETLVNLVEATSEVVNLFEDAFLV